MTSNKCSGCTENLKADDGIQCSRCVDKYHFSCLNISADKLRTFSDSYKATWICPSCRCKEPKKDNTHTPVRPTVSPINNTQLYENVTVRAKSKSSVSNCSCISADSIREIIRDELRSALNNQLIEIKNQISAFDQSLSFLSTEYDLIKKELEAHNKYIIDLQKENEILRTSTRELTHRFRQIDQQSRACNIEIHCVPEHRSEKILNLVQQLGKTINCPLRDEDIYYCSRIAKMNSSNPRPRSILVRFSNPRLRDTFLGAAITFNKKNPKDKLNTSHLGIADEKRASIYIVENLTPENKALHAAARLRAKELSYRYVWVRNGRIFMRKSEGTKFILIQDIITLKSLN